MALAQDYQQQIYSLMPKGLAWPRDENSVLAAMILGYAAELARVDGRVDAMLQEAHPLSAFETIADWENEFGLPDGCAGGLDTLQARRAAILQKMTRRGGQSRRFFIDLAATLGFSITIDEFRPFISGRGRSGDRIYGEIWRFVWRVNAPPVTFRYFRSGQSTSGERIRIWGNDLLECLISRLMPAQTRLIFAYEESP